MNCPNCRTVLETRAEPDVTVDICPGCGGLFLDHGELNALATGMQGDIEYSSVSSTSSNELSARDCPRCEERGETGSLAMRKVSVLQSSGIVLDWCPRCEGFFFDRGELDRMNAYLREVAGGAQEYREHCGPFVVRLDRTFAAETVSGLFASALAGTTYIEVRVYLPAPLGQLLLVTPEVWAVRLAKLFHSLPDIETGDPAFDRAYLVQGTDANAVRGLLSDEVRAAILDFRASEARVLGTKGAIELYDDHVLYREGPYLDAVEDDLIAASEDVRAALIGIAEKLEAAR